jgi:exosortase
MTAPGATRTTDAGDPVWPAAAWRAHRYAICFWLLSLVPFWQLLRNLASLSFQDENSSHILVIPFISAGLIFLRRKRIFGVSNSGARLGILLLLATALLWYCLKASLFPLDNSARLSLAASLMVLGWIAGFILFYGTSAFREASFPLLFLLLIVPLPAAALAHTVSILQKGSAETCYVLFRLLRIPVIRHGFLFSLPGVDIEIAQECSGIHSGLSLFITGLLAAHVFLPSAWKKFGFVLCVFPIAIFKNAVRIVTISWLGIHVNPEFFHGRLHRQGGLPFGVLALAILAVLLWLLRQYTLPDRLAQLSLVRLRGPRVVRGTQ